VTEEILRILIIQSEISWKDTADNLQKFSSLIQKSEQEVDLILLPEMFTTGFISTPEDVPEGMQERALEWLRQTAKSKNCRIAGSMIVSEDNTFYNQLVCAHPSSESDFYNKRHLFRMAGEDTQYSRGLQRTVSWIKGWRICWQICYDLRFPVWCRNQGDYDILVVVANWPANRGEVWNTLLRARAIENQCYVIGVNRIGEDGNRITYQGDSSVIDPKGNRINDPDKGEEKLIYAELRYSSLVEFRNKFPVMRDADKFMIL
jgi:predicted amidohydrolase